MSYEDFILWAKVLISLAYIVGCIVTIWLLIYNKLRAALCIMVLLIAFNLTRAIVLGDLVALVVGLLWLVSFVLNYLRLD